MFPLRYLCRLFAIAFSGSHVGSLRYFSPSAATFFLAFYQSSIDLSLATQVMVDQVYIPFLRDLTSLARNSCRLYVEFLILIGGFCVASATRLFFLVCDSLLFVLSLLFHDLLLRGWRFLSRHFGGALDAMRVCLREARIYASFVKYVVAIYLRAFLLRLSRVRTRIDSGMGSIGGAFGRRNSAAVVVGAASGDARPPASPSTSHRNASCSASSTSSPNTPTASSSQEAVLNALRRELTEAEERQRCVVCLSALKSMLILPCRHACLCRPCAVEIINHVDVNQRLCPLCRTLMHEVLHVYI